jgi:hypothetical protein
MRVVAAIAALVVAAGVAACGGGSDGNGASDSSSPKRDIQTEAQQRAEAFLLELGDFPDGWRASPPDPSDREDEEMFWGCLGSDFSAFTITGEAESKAFAYEDTSEASSDTTVMESEDQAQGVLRQLSNGMNSPAARGCVRDLMEKLMSEDESWEGAELGDVSVGELNVAAPSEVAETRSWQLVVEVEVTSGEAKGLSVEAYVDYMAMRHGDCIAVVQVSDVLTPFDSTLRNELLQKVAYRMSDECSPGD